MFYALCEDDMILSWYRKLIERLPEWLYYPLGGCYRCLGGQICFWYYLVVYFNHYSLTDHLFFVSAGILFAMIWHLIYILLEYLIKKYE
jgi:hypothetical protein